MNLLKKFVLPLLAFLCLAQSFAKSKEVGVGKGPIFEDSKVYVFNVDEVKGKAKDNIRLISQMTDSNTSFRVYAYSEKLHDWVLWGTGMLKGYGDSDFIRPDSKKKIKHYKWFAVKPMNDKHYEYEVSKRHDDLYITIFSKQ
jgi:hypothetical protein